MHDIKAIRADPAAFEAQISRRGANEGIGALRRIDAAVRGLSREVERKREENSEIDRQLARDATESKRLQAFFASLSSKAVNEHGNITLDNPTYDEFQRAKQTLEDHDKNLSHAIESTEVLRRTLPWLQKSLDEAFDEFSQELSGLPNLPAPDVPDGLDESANVVVHTRGTPPTFDFAPKEHDTLALRFGYDSDAATAIAGARFAVLTGPLARLHRALGNWMLSQNSAAGWTEVAPPLLVQPRAMFGTGQLPKFADDAFVTTDGRYLIPTAEVSLTNLIRGKVLDRDALPLRFTALTPCFRQEAGSAGRDTRGLIRQHQFDKVELVSIVADADAAAAEHELMTAQAESLLDSLGLPYRRMLLCAGDMGFSARKTYDLEVWLPGQGQYREISSVSDCGDFQARRMDVDEPKGGRFRTKGVKGTSFVHTLNGSALAVGRTLVAVIENYQRADGSVAVPAVLAPYMGGVEELMPHK